MSVVQLFLAVLDQLRFILGSLVILVLVSHRSMPHRARYGLRLTVGGLICILAALASLPLQRLFAPVLTRFPVLTAPYWLSMSFLQVFFVWYCYDTSLAGALFRAMMGSFVENIATVLIRYLFVGCLFPDFPMEHPILYILLMLAVYAPLYWGAWRQIGRSPDFEDGVAFSHASLSTGALLLLFLSFNAILSTTKLLCENVLLPLGGYGELRGIYQTVRYFLVAEMLLLSVMMTTLLWQTYERAALRAERQVMRQMARDRESQYEFSRENIEMINRKAHDLKHQLRALEQISDAERREQLRQTRKAIDFYDAVVKTGNEALDTLLTEKSVYCSNRGIRLSCTVNTKSLQRIHLVDLYTLLGNALDNAIESVERLSDPEKKTISLMIRDQGQMLYIQIENYYEGSIRIKGGLPQTRKWDKENHGYGVKSIRSIVARYGGQMQFSTEGQVFSLEILIPT